MTSIDRTRPSPTPGRISRAGVCGDFVVVRRVLGLIGLGPTPKDAEIAVPRHRLRTESNQT
jgi:hypothetical protein